MPFFKIKMKNNYKKDFINIFLTVQILKVIIKVVVMMIKNNNKKEINSGVIVIVIVIVIKN
jgi:hypothetical protein